ncbi:YcaO-like family protein [Halodesulfovibrio sp.]|jgi:bacteriocin biosynthesis cyclodehydratase domain-containing protein|uniref:YcaO-like family protein n=1 Tax=Halodesulfovibrio sp. TaxID=1912772 RepID=UPI0025FAFBE6|nr:YcaO-like family protein [Halodesulfovibrio sp.]MCT4535886.1 YcaO-like family protein [Halodesulfovibrio sp.]
MTATSNNSELTLNPHISFLRSTKEESVFSLYGKIKRLRWKQPSMSGEWLQNYGTSSSAAKDTTMVTALEKQLLRANILVHSHAAASKSIHSVYVYGTGKLADMVLANAGKKYSSASIIQVPFTEAPISSEDDQHTLHIICPEHATRGELARFNALHVKETKPFGFIYFNGKKIITGPVVIPDKTPCLSCLMTWQEKQIESHKQLQLTTQELTEIITAVPYSFSQDEVAERAVQLLLDQLTAASHTMPCSLAGCQMQFSATPQAQGTPTRFAHTTHCPTCHGGFASQFYDSVKDVIKPEAPIFTLEDVPTCQLDNGYRVLTPSQAKQLVDIAVANLNGSIQVQELHTGALDNVLPSFRAELQLPESSENILGFGKGIDKEQAYLSATFEAVERLCSKPRGNTQLLRASWNEVKDQALNIPKRIGTVHFYRNNDPFDEDMPIDWVWGQCLQTGKPVLTPASMVYVGSTSFAGKFYNASTGGIAAGTTPEDALLQGLMETIEHDAWMIWQANSLPCPEILKSSINDETIQKIISEIEVQGYQVRIRYIATELGIPVFRVWLVQPDSVEIYAAHGFGCHLNKHLALRRALTEAKLSMPQTMYTKAKNTRYMSKGNGDILNSRHSLFYLYHFTQVDLSAEGGTLSMEDIPNVTTGTVTGDLHKTLEILSTNIPDIQVIGVDLTDNAIGIPVVRVIPCGLQQLSHPLQVTQERLFTVPCTMGRRATPLTYRELFNGRYPF